MLYSTDRWRRRSSSRSSSLRRATTRSRAALPPVRRQCGVRRFYTCLHTQHPNMPALRKARCAHAGNASHYTSSFSTPDFAMVARRRATRACHPRELVFKRYTNCFEKIPWL